MGEDEVRAYLMKSFAEKHFVALTFAAFAIATAILYSPALNASFMGDDFNYLRFLVFNATALLNGEQWNIWLAPIFAAQTWIHFRPLPPVLFLIDYLAWGFNPIGWHISDFGLHIFISFLVFLILLNLTQKRWVSAASSLLFAILPIHVEAISWPAARADSLSTLWYLVGFLFFSYARMQGRVSLQIISVFAFAMALISKEAAITLPLLLLAYDLIYHWKLIKSWQQMLKLHLPYWVLLSGYAVLRLLIYNGMSEYALSRLLNLNWPLRLSLYATALADPLLGDVSTEMLVMIAACVVAALWIGNFQREIWLSVAWFGITILPSFMNIEDTIYDRFVYLPSVGLAIVSAGLLTMRFGRFRVIAHGVAWTALIGVAMLCSVALYNRNVAYARGAEISRLVPQQVRVLHPSVPKDSRMIFTGLPIVVIPRGVQAFGWMVDRAMQIEYNNPNLQAVSIDRFPLVLDRLDRTYFFEYNRRQVTERTDLIRALEERSRCANSSRPAIIWNFAQDAQGWEEWNDLSKFENRDGALQTRAEGNDPYMASPEIAISAIAVGYIEVVMRVRADSSGVQGAWYWLASGQADFAPDLQEAFPVQTDGEYRTYRVDITQHGRLFLGDKIVRLRLDPTDAPADIAIKSITVFAHCNDLQGSQCVCNPQ